MQSATFGLIIALLAGTLLPNLLKDVCKLKRINKIIVLSSFTSIAYASILYHPLA
jgi:hypothetical protein